MFLKLTSLYTGSKIRINLSTLTSYGPEMGIAEDRDDRTIIGSYVETKGRINIVKEMPEEIDELLLGSYVMIKGAHENRTSEVPQYTPNNTINDSEQSESRSR